MVEAEPGSYPSQHGSWLLPVATTLALLAVGGCGTERGPQEPIADSVPVTQLMTKAMGSHVAFGRLYGLMATSQHLWLGDAVGDPFLFMVRRPVFSLERAIGKKGEGPGDFKSATDLSLRAGDVGGIWVYDVTTKRMTRIPVDRNVGTTTLAVLPHEIQHAVWLGADRIIGITRDDKTRFVLLDSLGHQTSTMRGPFPGPDSIPLAVRSRIAAGVKLCPSPDGDRFAVIYLAVGRVELHDANGAELRLAEVPNPSDGDFIKDPDSGQWRARAPRNFYAGCSGTPLRLYALYSGRVRADHTPGEASSGRQIHVFRWDGSLEGIFELDRDATSIAVVGDSLLYLTALESDTVAVSRLPVGWSR